MRRVCCSFFLACLLSILCIATAQRGTGGDAVSAPPANANTNTPVGPPIVQPASNANGNTDNKPVGTPAANATATTDTTGDVPVDADGVPTGGVIIAPPGRAPVDPKENAKQGAIEAEEQALKLRNIALMISGTAVALLLLFFAIICCFCGKCW